MQLAEFTGYWIGNYTPEQQQTYRILNGDDPDNWPKTSDLAPVSIDLHRVCAFNPHHDEGVTTVEIAGGMRYAILMSYNDFKEVMERWGNAGLFLNFLKEDKK